MDPEIGLMVIRVLYVLQGDKGEPRIAATGIKGEPGSPGLPGQLGPKVKGNRLTLSTNHRLLISTVNTTNLLPMEVTIYIPFPG